MLSQVASNVQVSYVLCAVYLLAEIFDTSCAQN